jgi:hypothetical protein
VGFATKLATDMCQDLPLGKNRDLVSKNEKLSAAAPSGRAANNNSSGSGSDSSVMYQNYVKAFLLPTSLGDTASTSTSSSSNSSSSSAPLTKKEAHTLDFLRRYLPASSGAGTGSELSRASGDALADIEMELLHDSLTTHLTGYLFWLYGCVPPAAVTHPTNNSNSTPLSRLSTSGRQAVPYAHLPAFRAPLILTRNLNASTNEFKERQEYKTLVDEVRRYLRCI